MARRPPADAPPQPPAKRSVPAAWVRLAGVALFAAGVAAWGEGIRLPDGPGASLVYAKCQTCHDLQYVVDAKGLLPAQWRAVIASMQDYGLTATAPENEELLQYLTTYLGRGAPPGPPSSAQPTAAPDGRAVYERNCASCHGADGRGQPGSFPPLAGNPDLAKDSDFPVLVVLHGISGAIEVDGQHYEGSMPPFDHLADAEIAAVLNFVRGGWAGQAQRPAAPPVTPESVAGQRQRTMSAADVHAYRARSIR
ncbi:MAG: c-type cytochrome [Casimicrobiaceae bacterium]